MADFHCKLYGNCVSRVFGGVKRTADHMKHCSQEISLVVPAIPEHIMFLPKLIEAYASGDEVPEEVVVSLSNAHEVRYGQRQAIKRLGGASFQSFKLLEHQKALSHGPNRQAAVEHCSHDIISFFDCDDLPYPNRISILKQVFGNREILHANHGFTFLGKPLVMQESRNIPILAGPDLLLETYFPNGNIADCKSVSTVYGSRLKFQRRCEQLAGITAGHVTVRTEVFEKVRWKDWDELKLESAEDYEFDIECLYYFRKSVILNLALSQYRVGHKPGNRISRWLRKSGRELIGGYNNTIGHA